MIGRIIPIVLACLVSLWSTLLLSNAHLAIAPSGSGIGYRRPVSRRVVYRAPHGGTRTAFASARRALV
jgi:hypothetical protein